jgi:hypothetical protein
LTYAVIMGGNGQPSLGESRESRAWLPVLSCLATVAVMTEAAVILVTPIESMIDTIAPAIPISFNAVAFLVQMALDAIALAIESFR